MPQSPKSTTPRSKRLQEALTALSTGLVERDLAIRLALLAALAGEHMLLVGPPGTAKSLVARRLHLAFASSSYFERLLTRFTVPEELFGPLSIKALEEDRYERITTAYLPTASVAFLDEVFKANSAILNALLTLLNEREFDNGNKRSRTPLISVIGASNELPEGEELDALFDRFLVRLYVGQVSSEAFPALLALRGDPTPQLAEALRWTEEELTELRRESEQVVVPDDVVALLCALRSWCIAEELTVSDRRWRKVMKLLQISALSNGRDKVSIWDAWLLQHLLWDTPERRASLYEWYAARVGASAAMDPARLTKIVTSWEAVLKRDQDARAQAQDKDGKPLFVGVDGKPTAQVKQRVHAKRKGEALYLAPTNAMTHHWGDGIHDRTNGGQGFTEDELNPLYVQGYTQFHSWRSRGDYLTNQANWMIAEAQLSALMEPLRHKALYVDDCLKQIAELAADVTRYKAALTQHIKSMQAEVRAHLWVADDFIEPAAASLRRTEQQVDALYARVDRLKRGYELLPREASPTAPKGGKRARS